jgi:TonB family protein
LTVKGEVIMSKKVLFNLALSIFGFAFLFASTVFAQAESCALKIDVTQNDGETKITGVTATAINSATKRVYKSVLKGGMPYFAKLPEGEYRITATRAGYMRSADDFNHFCLVDEVSVNFELYKGSSAKTVRLYNRTSDLKAPPTRQNPEISVLKGEVNKESPPPNNEGAGVGDELPPVPKPTPKSKPLPKVISGGILNGKATNLVKPEYPAAARTVRAGGAVNIQVTIDEEGNVISAAAASGDPLLRAAALKAARESKFSPTFLSGRPVKVTGVIVYNFVP